MNIDKILKELTIDEKIALVQGTDFMYTNPIPRLGIKSIRMSDGPHGLRVQESGGDNGVTGSKPATCFPTAATVSSSFNPNNTYKMGQALGKEALYYGIDIILGPGVCIKRNPLCGRNFEYFSEDPHLSGMMGQKEVEGIQENNVGVSVKHFALNSQENYRFLGDSICDERAIREIYLKAFEMIVKQSKPDTIMCSYNKINGTYACENNWLLNKVLREEWGFDGLVMSDWGATHNRVQGIKSGLDIEMPGDTLICRKWIKDAVNDGKLDIKYLDQAVLNILKLVDKYENNKKVDNIDWEEHHKIAREIAEDSAVLLKNDNILPLSIDENLLIVGELFENMRYQGSGSSMVNPTYLITPKEAFDKNNIKYEYEKGYSVNKSDKEENLINQVLNKTKNYDKVLVFIGLTDYIESEGCDRESMNLPNNQIELIKSLINTGKKIILVMFGGSSFELPFNDQVSGILNMFLPGQAGGEAVYNLLFGNISPSGKLSETWVKQYSDVPFNKEYSKTKYELYKESIFVGYRYYSTNNVEVNYPFGYGLTYTKFKYSDIKINKENDKYIIFCNIENIGNFDASEIVQLYVKAPLGVLKPIKELKGFTKIFLKQGEKKEVSIVVSIEDLKYWNIKLNRWVLEDGEYSFEISSSSIKCELFINEYIKGEKIESPYDKEIEKLYLNNKLDLITDELFERMIGTKLLINNQLKPITVESRFSDLSKSRLMGRIVYKAVLSVARKQYRQAKKLPDGILKENKIKGSIFLERVLNSNSLITMSMCGGNSFPYNFAEGFANFANGKIIKGIKCFTSKIDAPELPKNQK